MNTSSLDWLKPLRLAAEARRILRQPDAQPDAQPGAWALFQAWLDLAGSAPAPAAGSHLLRVGPLTLHAHSHGDCRELFEEIFLSRVYETRLGTHTPFILDCGGNVGFATVYFKLHYPAARVVTFEPNPRCFSLLQQNVEGNGLRHVTLVNAACGRADGEVSFFVNPQYSMAGSAQMKWSADSTTCVVKQVRLSNYIHQEVDLLKLDVEGAEWEVLEELIASGKIQAVRRMIIEYHHRMESPAARLGRFLCLLDEAGFTYDLLATNALAHRFGDKWQAVMLFATRRPSG